jgi:ribonuclease E
LDDADEGDVADAAVPATAPAAPSPQVMAVEAVSANPAAIAAAIAVAQPLTDSVASSEAPATALPPAAAAPVAVVPSAAVEATREVQPAPPATAAPIVVPALRLDQLTPVLAAAGLELVQTDDGRLAQTQQRMASEPPAPRRGRERPALPPIDSMPLQQVETRQN